MNPAHQHGRSKEQWKGGHIDEEESVKYDEKTWVEVDQKTAEGEYGKI